MLERLPANHEGIVPLARFSAPAALSQLYITRLLSADGPHLQMFGASGEYPLDHELLRKKLATPYDWSGRLDLLAYVDGGEIAFDDAIEQIEALVTQRLTKSSFRAVWVYEGLLDRIPFAVCRAS